MKNFFYRSSLAVLLVLFLAMVIVTISGKAFLITGVIRTYVAGNITANINDHTEFQNRLIKTSEPQEIPRAAAYNQTDIDEDLRGSLIRTGSVGFLVVKDDELLFEEYFNGYHNRSKTNSFSMAKTVTTLLIGLAIEDGYIDGLEQKIVDFIPEFKSDANGVKATIGQLSLMNSGYEWTEHYYSPFSPTVELFYGPDVEDFLLKGHFSAEPGSYWEYSSASTQLLAIVLQRALEQSNPGTSISDYLGKKLWQPLGMNDDALWHLDDSGMELAFCCINTNLRNFTKLGMLMLNKGSRNGEQLISSSFIDKMLQAEGQSYYGYSTWLQYDQEPHYYWFSGHLGQYIIIVPEHKLVIVRLGETRDSNDDFRETELPRYVAQAIKLTKPSSESKTY